MLLIQLTGLPGAGKSTIASGVKTKLREQGLRAEVIDADIYRKKLCPDLGFSKADRHENIRRLGLVSNLLAINGVIAILAAINPYEEIRRELMQYGTHVKIVWIKCDLEILIKRDPKELYKRAMYPDGHPEKIVNLTGINDPYEPAINPDLVIDTGRMNEEESVNQLFSFIMKELKIEQRTDE